MWEVTDSDGHPVSLSTTAWHHIVDKHPNLDVSPEAIVRIVEAPDEHIAGREPTERWFYGRGAGPTAWIKVVVHYEGDRGRIVTAFPRRSFP